MLRTLSISAAAVLLASPLASAQPVPDTAAADPAQSVLPGRWSYTYKIGFIPVDTEFWCLKAGEVRRAFTSPCNSKHTCTYTTQEMADGRIKLVGQWMDKKGRVAPVSAQGGYTPTTLNLRIRMRTTGGLPLAGSMSGKRVGETCAAGDK